MELISSMTLLAIKPELDFVTKLAEKSKVEKVNPVGPNFSINPLSMDKNVDK